MHHAWHRCVFVDTRPDTQNIDERRVRDAVTPRTRAIVVVHYAGVACEMDAVLAVAREFELFVVEDNAHGSYGEYKGRPLGTLGHVGAQGRTWCTATPCTFHLPSTRRTAESMHRVWHSWGCSASQYLPSTFLVPS